MRGLSWLSAVLAGCFAFAADSALDQNPQVEARQASSIALTPSETSSQLVPETPVLERSLDCHAQIAKAMAQPSVPGAPELEARKGEVLLYAKGEPAHFVRRPQAGPELTQAAVSYRAMLRRSRSPWSLLQRLSSLFASNPQLGRAVVLSEGYLYAEEPKLAFALVDLISTQLLFTEKQLWIQRGEQLMHASRDERGKYVFVDGVEAGERVRLMLYDRIGVDQPPPALHRDFRALRQRLGFEQARIIHETETAVVAELRYGTLWVRSLLAARDASMRLQCEEVGDHESELVRFREEQAERLRLLDPLRRAILQQVDEGLPFDEPRTEYGQQDGQLRLLWQRAYASGALTYELNDDTYYVFDREGRPKVPQVCIDFIFDSFERASGTWWQRRGEPRARALGTLDFSGNTSLNLRRANSLVELARARPDWLDRKALPESERIPFKYSPELARYLTRHADDYRPGDVVIIRGEAPWDKPWKPRIMHMHSFFVYETDPMSGMPIVLAGNPGQPVLQTWQFEAFRTPERSIQYRIRPRSAWLRSFLKGPSDLPAVARLTIDPHEPRVPLDVPTPPGVPLGDARSH
jgi:hypothetical protein